MFEFKGEVEKTGEEARYLYAQVASRCLRSAKQTRRVCRIQQTFLRRSRRLRRSVFQIQHLSQCVCKVEINQPFEEHLIKRCRTGPVSSLTQSRTLDNSMGAGETTRFDTYKTHGVIMKVVINIYVPRNQTSHFSAERPKWQTRALNINCNFRSVFQLAVNQESKFTYLTFKKGMSLCQLCSGQITTISGCSTVLSAENESHTRPVTTGSHRSITFRSLDLTATWKALRSSTTWSLPTARITWRTFIPVEYHFKSSSARQRNIFHPLTAACILRPKSPNFRGRLRPTLARGLAFYWFQPSLVPN